MSSGGLGYPKKEAVFKVKNGYCECLGSASLGAIHIHSSAFFLFIFISIFIITEHTQLLLVYFHIDCVKHVLLACFRRGPSVTPLHTRFYDDAIGVMAWRVRFSVKHWRYTHSHRIVYTTPRVVSSTVLPQDVCLVDLLSPTY